MQNNTPEDFFSYGEVDVTNNYTSSSAHGSSGLTIRTDSTFDYLGETSMITVYTLPNCVQCDNTKRLFDRGGVTYETVDLSKDEEAMTMVQSLGYQAAPIVMTEKGHWGGFRLEKIRNLITEVHRPEVVIAS